MRIAVIPARAGSTRLKNKNRLPLAGKPLIEYVLSAAVESKGFDRIVVNSDDIEYQVFAEKYEAEFYLRDCALAKVDSDIVDVLIDFVSKERIYDGWLYLFQPTNPFVTKSQICDLIQLEMKGSYSLVQNTAEVPHACHAWNQRHVTNQGFIDFLFREERLQNYQAQKKPNLLKFGNLLGVSVQGLLSAGTLWMEQSGFVVIRSPYDFDIDTEQDLRMAEAIIDAGLVELE